MAQLLMIILVSGATGMKVEWTDFSIHFYGPVDIAADAFYREELSASLDSLLATIPLDAERTLGDAVARSHDAQNYFETSLAYPQVVSTRYSTATPDEIQNEYALRLLGPFVEDLIPPPSHRIVTRGGEPQDSLPEEFMPVGIPSTGFIIDARGAGFMPGVFPRLLDPEGNVILEPTKVERGVLLERGYIRYAYSPREALETRELGLNPLRVIAERVAGHNRCDLVLSASDAEQITSSPLNERLLTEGRVIIIIDRP